MSILYKTKKGLDLRLAGEAAPEVTKLAVQGEYAVRPADFCGLKPRLLVAVGDHVEAGSALLSDKNDESLLVVSPVAGKVVAVNRGERRRILDVRVAADAAQPQAPKAEPLQVATLTPEEAMAAMAKAGLTAYVRQRPYDVVPTAKQKPDAIFVSLFSKMPLAAQADIVLGGRERELKAGIALLSRIAPVYVGICPQQEAAAYAQGLEAQVSVFDGPNPSGCVGVQINHVRPINRGDLVWTLSAEAVVWAGELALTGKPSWTRRIAVAGSRIAAPRHVETLAGTSLSRILDGQLMLNEGHVRIINGNPLVGQKSTIDDFLAAHASEVCAIPEGDDCDEVLGWMMPRLRDFSTHRSYFSWLMGRGRSYDLDCRIKGGERHMIMSGEYDRVFPMDVFAGYLIKAIIAGDIDRQEALGIYEVAPEDFAVAEFVDSSKLELQRIVREGLDILRKENA